MNIASYGNLKKLTDNEYQRLIAELAAVTDETQIDDFNDALDDLYESSFIGSYANHKRVLKQLQEIGEMGLYAMLQDTMAQFIIANGRAIVLSMLVMKLRNGAGIDSELLTLRKIQYEALRDKHQRIMSEIYRYAFEVKL